VTKIENNREKSKAAAAEISCVYILRGHGDVNKAHARHQLTVRNYAVTKTIVDLCYVTRPKSPIWYMYGIRSITREIQQSTSHEITPINDKLARKNV